MPAPALSPSQVFRMERTAAKLSTLPGLQVAICILIGPPSDSGADMQDGLELCLPPGQSKGMRPTRWHKAPVEDLPATSGPWESLPLPGSFSCHHCRAAARLQQGGGHAATCNHHCIVGAKSKQVPGRGNHLHHPGYSRPPSA